MDFSINFAVLESDFDRCVRHIISTVVDKTEPSASVADAWNIERIGEIMAALLSLWRPKDPTNIPYAFIELLKWQRLSDFSLRGILTKGGDIQSYLWAHFPKTLPSFSRVNFFLAALWHLASFYPSTDVEGL